MPEDKELEDVQTICCVMYFRIVTLHVLATLWLLRR